MDDGSGNENVNEGARRQAGRQAQAAMTAAANDLRSCDLPVGPSSCRVAAAVAPSTGAVNDQLVNDDGARSVSQSAEERLDFFVASHVVGGPANIVLQLFLRSPLQELSDDLDFAIDSRQHEGCASIISLLVNVCPRSQQGFGAFKMPFGTRPVECDPAIRILQGQEVDRKRWRREA